MEVLFEVTQNGKSQILDLVSTRSLCQLSTLLLSVATEERAVSCGCRGGSDHCVLGSSVDLETLLGPLGGVESLGARASVSAHVLGGELSTELIDVLEVWQELRGIDRKAWDNSGSTEGVNPRCAKF